MGKKFDRQAEELLAQYGFTKPPINVEKLALKMDLGVVPTDLGPGVSGALVIQNGSATIGINPEEPRVRRRFTVAHELAHFVLHHSQNVFFVDKPSSVGSKVLYRDADSSSGEYLKERQANAFAAALLMPENLLKKEIELARKEQMIQDNDDLVYYLSKKFDVSEIAMTYRLSNLNFIEW